MTMHLLPAFVTTTRSSRSNKSQRSLEHLLWIQRMTGGKRSDRKLLRDSWTREYAEAIRAERSTNTGVVAASTAPRTPQVYSGERKLIGVATMHKSNAVPVFSKDTAAEIAKMRRG